MLHCPVCGSLSHIVSGSQFNAIIGSRPELAICSRCDHWFVVPMPNECELDAFYAHGLVMDAKAYLGQYRSKKLRVFKRILGGIELPPSPCVVEVGPGPIGIASIVPTSAHYVAVEPGSNNNAMLAQCAAKNGLRIDCVDNVAKLVTLGVRFDLAFSVASFEHMISPRQALKQLVQCAKPGAWIVLGLPLRCLEFPDEELVRRGLYPGIDYCSTHLHSFSPRSGRSLLESCGIEIISEMSTLTTGRVRSYQALNRAWKDFTVDRNKAQNLKWHLHFLLRLMILYAFKLIDRTPRGDDRCEVVYVGRLSCDRSVADWA